jgi:hypothetical protein
LAPPKGTATSTGPTRSAPFPWDTRRTKILAASALLVLLVASSPAGADITVRTISDATNGDVATVAGLIANPGPDGISLREAIEATNNDPGSYTIGFAPALRGKVIMLRSVLPHLTGGGVTIDGDISGNGKPDVTLRALGKSSIGFSIASSGNRLHALELSGFGHGVVIEPAGSLKKGDFPNHRTFADNTVSGLVMRGIRVQGIVVDPTGSGNCGVPCRASNRWVNTTITGNTIEARLAGIFFFIGSTSDLVEHVAITGNTIRIVGTAKGPGIGVHTSGESTGARISDVLVARNSIEGSPDIGIQVAPGTFRAQAGVVEHVRVLGNRLHLVRRGSYFCCQGIVVQAGSDAPGPARGPPLRYLDDNLARDVLVRGNSVSGALAWGVQVVAAYGGGGRRNRVERVRLERNVIRSSTVATGLYLVVADGTPFKNRYATGNRIARVSIDANRIAIGRSPNGNSTAPIPGGIALQGGGPFGRGNAIRDVRITDNRIATSQVGITLVGGFRRPSHGNSVTCVRLARNHITGTRKTVTVRANVGGARGNRASLGGC